MSDSKKASSNQSPEKDDLQFTALDKEALEFHSRGRPGKVALESTKPLTTQHDLSLAYSPGVAAPCREIARDPSKVNLYTAKANTVAIVTNGSAVLGLGNLGPLAAKPVMEGKAVLFKRFADIDGVDIEVKAKDAEEFINCVKCLEPSWGGINLEDIGAPDCFIIEARLRELMDIPVFHDDQHGTAIITAAGVINAAYITGRKLENLKVVVNGAGAAGIACLELLKAMGVKDKNAYLCDRDGIVYKGKEDLNEWKAKHAIDTKARTLMDAMKGADLVLGLSVKGAINQEMVKVMAKNPIIFAMANPDPEITPEDVKAVRSDAIIATGRSDYPNQVNNVMGFPYIFRGALDVHATMINNEMKIAAANALAALARERVPDEVSKAYSGRSMAFGSQYIIPVPFDPRLISTIPLAVAKAAMDSGVARKPIEDMAAYRQLLAARLNPAANLMSLLFDKVKDNPTRMVFAEGEEEPIIRAALQWRDNGYGTPILVGREHLIRATLERIDDDGNGVEIHNAAITTRNSTYIDYLYERTQRKGFLHRDCTRMVKNDRNIFGACMVACGDGDAMVTGLTRSHSVTLNDILNAIDCRAGKSLFGMSIVFAEEKTVFIADTSVCETPTAEELVNIAIDSAQTVKDMGYVPRVAFMSYANFGNPLMAQTQTVRDAIAMLDARSDITFEYDGEMSPEVALNEEMMRLYPFSRLTAPANILVMPSLHTASIATKLFHTLSDGVLIGPIMIGLEKPVQMVPMNSTLSDIMNIAAIAAVGAIKNGH